MQYIIGALSSAAFFACVALAYIAGSRSKRPQAQKSIEVPEEELRRSDSMRRGFVNMMNYDMDTALGRKKVT